MLFMGVAKLRADCVLAGRPDLAVRWDGVSVLCMLGGTQARARAVAQAEHVRFIVASCRPG